jgi:hypothetical protein
MSMWTITGVQSGTRRVRQHGDLSYWMSDDEVILAMGINARLGSGPWAATAVLESLLASRRGGGLQANLDPGIGALEFFVERRDTWNSLFAATWADDEARSPGHPVATARAEGRDTVWHLEGFDPVRMFMVEDFELSHRICESELFAVLGNPSAPYYGGKAPTKELVDLVNARIGLQLRCDEIDYQVNVSSRYATG